VTVISWKSIWKSLFFSCLSILHWTLPKILMYLDWQYPNWGKILHSRFQIDCCKQHLNFEHVSSDSNITEINMEITVYSSFSWPASLPFAHPPPGWLVWLPTSCQFPTAFGSPITAGLSCTLPGEWPSYVDYWRKSPQFWCNDYYQMGFLLGNVSAYLCGSTTHHYPLHILW